MMSWVITKAWPYIAVTLAVLAILVDVFRRGGVNNQRKTQLEDYELDDEGRNNVYREQTETRGLSSSALVDRMRGRDSDWGGM